MNTNHRIKFHRTHLVVALLILLIASATATVARAQDSNDRWIMTERAGNYFSLSGGWTQPMGDMTIPGASTNGVLAFPETRIALKSGYMGMAAVGVYQENFRGEVEFSYRNNDISHAVNMPNITSLGGHITAYSIMANGYGDLPITKRISGYMGIGLGLAILDMTANATQTTGPSYEISGNPAAFALQAMVGVNVQVTRRVYLTGGYRFWSAIGADASFISTGGGTIVNVHSNNHFDLPVIHGPEVGLRVDF